MVNRGLLGFGAYIPRRRLPRARIAEAMDWANPSLRAAARGERRACNWDEDSITMAVEAARDCLATASHEAIATVALASTTMPFADRANAALVAAALHLGQQLRCLDFAASQRAATAAFAELLHRPADSAPSLLVAADRRLAKPASLQEMHYGHGAAAVLLGEGEIIAEFLGSRSSTQDLVDHYRGAGAAYDYFVEERWVRDEGYMKLIPPVISELMAASGLSVSDIDHLILPCPAGVGRRVAKALGADPETLADDLSEVCGHTGVAHPLLMLAQVLERAAPDELVLITGFGQGVDAVLLRTTETLLTRQPPRGVRGHLAAGAEERSYLRFLSFGGLLPIDWGQRAEFDRRTALTTLYRKRDAVDAFVGGHCDACGTIQFPFSLVCVNPACRASHTQNPFRFADCTGTVKTFTEDWLAFSPSPPLMYGNVQFEGGGNLMMEFTDCEPGQLTVGMPLRMMFRVKDVDERRGFRRYFWKPAPLEEAH